VLGGLRDAEPDDDKLVRAAGAVFDALYAGPGDRGGMSPARSDIAAIVPSPAPLSRRRARRASRRSR
jgi:hypothetical protein